MKKLKPCTPCVSDVRSKCLLKSSAGIADLEMNTASRNVWSGRYMNFGGMSICRCATTLRRILLDVVQANALPVERHIEELARSLTDETARVGANQGEIEGVVAVSREVVSHLHPSTRTKHHAFHPVHLRVVGRSRVDFLLDISAVAQARRG